MAEKITQFTPGQKTTKPHRFLHEYASYLKKEFKGYNIGSAYKSKCELIQRIIRMTEAGELTPIDAMKELVILTENTHKLEISHGDMIDGLRQTFPYCIKLNKGIATLVGVSADANGVQGGIYRFFEGDKLITDLTQAEIVEW